MACVPYEEFWARHRFTNIYASPLATWHVEQARQRATKIVVWNGLVDVFVLLGKRVQAAFGFPDEIPGSTRKQFGANFIMLPHPSGMNRWYNDLKNRLIVVQLVRYCDWLVTR